MWDLRAVHWVALVFFLCVAWRPVEAQLGTTSRNVSSSSSQLSYVGVWHSDQHNGVYEAYSNDSSAAATFSFTGVGVSYVGYKKFDRGLCVLRLDDKTSYTISLFDDSGFAQPEVVIWTSPVLPYGNHTVTLAQIGIDSRLGVYPFLLSETWIEVVPTDAAAYTATEVLTTATSSYFGPTASPTTPSPPSSPGIAPIVGGTVGGVVALVLVAFLYLLWRRDKQQMRRNEPGMGNVEKARRADKNKMTIDDDEDDDGAHSYGSGEKQLGDRESERELERRHARERDEFRRASVAAAVRVSPRQAPHRLSTQLTPTGSIPSPSSDLSYPAYAASAYPSTSHHYQSSPTPPLETAGNFRPLSLTSQQPAPYGYSRGARPPEIQEAEEIRNVERAGRTRAEARHEFSHQQPPLSAASQYTAGSDYGPARWDERSAAAESRGNRDRRSNTSGSGSYPYHTQGYGDERRAFPVPEV